MPVLFFLRECQEFGPEKTTGVAPEAVSMSCVPVRYSTLSKSSMGSVSNLFLTGHIILSGRKITRF